jgi:nitrous oxidase accessory protein NosD
MRVIAKLGTATACIVLGSGAFVPAASGATTIVVHPGESIQQAITSAHRGDTVQVEAGTYHEGLVITTNGLKLIADGKVVLKPSAAGGLCDEPDVSMGICILPADTDQNGVYSERVKNVSITGFRIREFTGFGIFGYGTENLRISDVRAVDNAIYGIARFDGIGGYIANSWAVGSDEAGIYVGDSPDADARVWNNHARQNGIGIFVRHAREVTVKDNVARKNCMGIFLLDDGQPEGSGDNRVAENVVDENNRVCPGDAEEGIPETGGGGIVLFGSQDNVIRDNRITDNRGHTVVSGGLVLLTSTDSGKGSTGNQVRHNWFDDNQPYDIVQDSGSTNNTFTNNSCDTSSPSGIC